MKKQLDNLWGRTKAFLPWLAGLYLAMAAINRVEQNSPSFALNRQNFTGTVPVPGMTNAIDPNTNQNSGGFLSSLLSSQSNNQTVGYQVDCSANPSVDGLNLRQAPNGAIINLIPCNANGVQIAGNSVEQDGIAWVPVNYGGQTGWVADGFLR